MITKEQAMALTHGTTLYHSGFTNKDGTPMRCRVNGTCWTWKTRPEEFRLPVKMGMYKNAYITQVNAAQWFELESEVALWQGVGA